ncbi:hypothetical protein QQP08_008057, partial [Theobroma cacao]
LNASGEESGQSAEQTAPTKTYLFLGIGLFCVCRKESEWVPFLFLIKTTPIAIIYSLTYQSQTPRSLSTLEICICQSHRVCESWVFGFRFFFFPGGAFEW